MSESTARALSDGRVLVDGIGDGQAMVQPGPYGDVVITVLTARGTFPSTVAVSKADALALSVAMKEIAEAKVELPEPTLTEWEDGDGIHVEHPA